jgi:hypothetical protein
MKKKLLFAFAALSLSSVPSFASKPLAQFVGLSYPAQEDGSCPYGGYLDTNSWRCINVT